MLLVLTNDAALPTDQVPGLSCAYLGWNPVEVLGDFFSLPVDPVSVASSPPLEQSGQVLRPPGACAVPEGNGQKKESRRQSTDCRRLVWAYWCGPLNLGRYSSIIVVPSPAGIGAENSL